MIIDYFNDQEVPIDIIFPQTKVKEKIEKVVEARINAAANDE